jgi:hypothetical protein
MEAPRFPTTTKERQPTSHSSTISALGYSPQCFAASKSIRPGNAVYVKMSDSSLQTATIGGRVRWDNQDLFFTAARPFRGQPSDAPARGEKEAPPENLFHVGSLYYSSHLNGHPEHNYALIRPEPDVHMDDDVKLCFSQWILNLRIPRFTTQKDFTDTFPKPRVRAVTASAGVVVGELEGRFGVQDVYDVTFNVPITLEDLGSWVFDASDNRLLGHIAAMYPISGVILIVPAYRVFADLARKLTEDAEIQERAK